VQKGVAVQELTPSQRDELRLEGVASVVVTDVALDIPTQKLLQTNDVIAESTAKRLEVRGGSMRISC
jgi:hypothetical protein